MSEQLCVKCGTECYRESVDVGVGFMYGPWGCPMCGWSEDSDYDHSEGGTPADVKPGWFSDQYGNLHNEERQKEIEDAAILRFVKI